MKFDSFIYIILAAVCVIGITLSFSTVSHLPDALQFNIKSGNEILVDDTLLTDHEYSLVFDNLDHQEECFWQVVKESSGDHEISIYFHNLTHIFTEPGNFHVQAFYNQRIALDTVLTVMPGLKAGFSYDIRNFYPEKDIQFINKSKGANSYSWYVLDDKSDTLEKAFDREFSWLPTSAGAYQVGLLASSENGKQKEFVETIEVTNKPVVKEPRPKRSTTKSIKKKPAPVKVDKIKKDASGNFAVGFTPVESINIGPVAPDKKAVEYRAGNTKIEIKPSEVIRIGYISYWGNIDQPGGYHYSIRCTSCAGSNNVFSRNSSTTKDFGKPQTQKIRYPGDIALLPGETYTLTIETLNEAPCLGFFTPSDRTILMGELAAISFLSPSSCVFNLTLEKN